jgi:hypothetical protein
MLPLKARSWRPIRATFLGWLQVTHRHSAIGVSWRRSIGPSLCCATFGRPWNELSTQNLASSSLPIDARVQIPAHTRGYRILPFSWEELDRIIQADDDLSSLSRSVETQYDYEISKLLVMQVWYSVYDHILCSKFDFPSKLDPDSGLRKSRTEDVGTAQSHRALLPNDFPYFVQEPIQHWVLWKFGDDVCNTEDVDWAKAELQERIGPVREFLHWINPPHLKSIPDIDHVHILCLPESSDNAT